MAKSESSPKDDRVTPFGYTPGKLGEIERIVAMSAVAKETRSTSNEIRPFGADAFERDVTDYAARPDLRSARAAD